MKNYKNIPKVYIAGKLGDPAVHYIRNLHVMIKSSETIRQAGFAVFVPGLNFLQGVMFGYWTYEDYFDNDQPWLLSADAIYMCSNWRDGSGTWREKEIAEENGIPVFEHIDDLKEHFKDRL